MKAIDGRTYATRAELSELGYGGRSTLYELWRHRTENGHPEAVVIDGQEHWDKEAWLDWRRASIRERNTTTGRGRRREPAVVDRTGAPDELLPPAQQAKVLGITVSAISGYRKRPPKHWPAADHTELTPSGRVRQFRTRRTLWAYADAAAADDARVGAAGRKPGPRPTRPAYEGDPRLEIATQALAATSTPEQTRHDIATDLSSHHGGSPRTWERLLTAAAERAE